MTPIASQYFLVVKRNGKQTSAIDLFEHVTVEVIDHFKIRCSDESTAYQIYCSKEQPLKISRVDYSERPYFIYFWYDEKYICDNAFALYERASELELPGDFLLWLASRL